MCFRYWFPFLMLLFQTFNHCNFVSLQICFLTKLMMIAFMLSITDNSWAALLINWFAFSFSIMLLWLDIHCMRIWHWFWHKLIKFCCMSLNNFTLMIDNEIYLYKMLTTNLLQAMLIRRAKQSHQHRQSSNSALLTRWAHAQSKSEAMTTQSSTHWSSHIHRMTATSLHISCNSYTTYTHILQRQVSAFAHIQTDVMQ